MPWPKEITDHPALDGLTQVASEIGARVQGVLPTEEMHSKGLARATLYSRSGSMSAGYDRREVVVEPRLIVQACATLPEVESAVDELRDLLVCTHGARDRCCGSLGTSLHAEAPVRRALRVSRTTHTGGHRFAPTAVLLPEGTVWAWLDAELLASIVDRTGPIAKVLPHYRGSTAMPTPELQFAEREVLAEVGWAWLDTPRRGRLVSDADDTIRVEISSPLGSWHATVVRTGRTPQPACGLDASGATKHDPVLELADLRWEPHAP